MLTRSGAFSHGFKPLSQPVTPPSDGDPITCTKFTDRLWHMTWSSQNFLLPDMRSLTIQRDGNSQKSPLPKLVRRYGDDPPGVRTRATVLAHDTFSPQPNSWDFLDCLPR
ncbi:hypothetical protein J3458_005910 [Metarhizium acridum]|uniref:uncharacterized protein n=1 Tax=Metarhizium acridum TaxID=92637 RepID=UPI001C6B2F55|nr:hypothetical protein J3458_005910 [Metarhizium acridum]